jgi:DNA-binding SARP family transcriptional activator
MELLSQVGQGGDLAARVGDLLERIEAFERQIPTLRRQLRRRVSRVTFAQPRWRINALGRMEILHDGQPLTKRDWTQQRAVRELFFLVLAHPEGLTKEAICNLLWPMSETGELNKQFRNTIYKLRRALSGRAILEQNGFYQFNRSLDYHYDVELLEEKLDLARVADELDEKLTAVREALDLYRGPFLLEAEGTWVIEERQRVWRVFSDVIHGVIEVCLEQEAYRRALTLCERLLKEDPYLEAAYRSGMCAYAGLGHRPGIVRYFQRCKTNLKEGLDISPSPETVELYHRLIGE